MIISAMEKNKGGDFDRECWVGYLYNFETSQDRPQ